MEQENIPFNGGLEKTDINKWRGTDDLKVIRGNGDFIVRERVFTNKDFDLPRNFYLMGDEQKRKLLIDKTSKIKKTIEDLISFGVNVAYHLVILVKMIMEP